MRLAKYLAKAGVTSRRKAEELIRQGKVQVNNVIAGLPQQQVNPEDLVTVDGKQISLVEKKIYIILNKPSGFISTVKDTHGRPTIMALLEDINERIFPIGRLDADTTGVLLLTNDGELAYRLTHPKYNIPKIYRVWVKGVPRPKELSRMKKGLILEGEKTAPAKVNIVKVGADSKTSLLEIALTEGRKRQVKKMCLEINHPVIELTRISFAGLNTENLLEGSYRHLTEQEINVLKHLTGL
ncbi:MAG: pseudouridine synthase [Bacillota bacterium]|nr:pseudouridine synthase [Bacillota bacterium]